MPRDVAYFRDAVASITPPVRAEPPLVFQLGPTRYSLTPLGASFSRYFHLWSAGSLNIALAMASGGASIRGGKGRVGRPRCFFDLGHCVSDTHNILWWRLKLYYNGVWPGELPASVPPDLTMREPGA